MSLSKAWVQRDGGFKYRNTLCLNAIDIVEKVRVYDKGVTANADPASRNRVLVDYRVGDMHAPHIDNTEPVKTVCQAFVDAIERGIRPPTDGLAGLRVVRLLAAAQESIHKNGERIVL